MQYYLRIQCAVSIRIRAGEHIHLDPARTAVSGRKEPCVIGEWISLLWETTKLRVREDRIALNAPAPEIRVLIITGRFGETQLVEFVVHPVAPVKKVHHGRIRRIGRIRG